MALRQPFGNDFDPPTMLPNRPEVSVRFKPTQAIYIFSVVTDRAERTRIGAALAPGCIIHREGTNLGGYDDTEVEREARKLALALAEKIVRGS
jgi:hypothetical protein